MSLTIERLREALAYDPSTGIFTWLIKASKNTVIGEVAGCKTPGMPVRIRLDGVLYRAHRLAWFYMTGEWPTNMIDHKNGVNVANYFNNLRDVSRVINLQNQRKAHVDNKTGLLGVSSRGDTFVAQIYHAGRARFLGSFPTPDLAHAAYVTAKRAFHEGNTL